MPFETLVEMIFLDIDECVLGNDNCHSDASCINLKGSFNCTCKDGYRGNGSYCKGSHYISFFINSTPFSTVFSQQHHNFSSIDQSYIVLNFILLISTTEQDMILYKYLLIYSN